MQPARECKTYLRGVKTNYLVNDKSHVLVTDIRLLPQIGTQFNRKTTGFDTKYVQGLINNSRQQLNPKPHLENTQNHATLVKCEPPRYFTAQFYPQL